MLQVCGPTTRLRLGPGIAQVRPVKLRIVNESQVWTQNHTSPNYEFNGSEWVTSFLSCIIRVRTVKLRAESGLQVCFCHQTSTLLLRVVNWSQDQMNLNYVIEGREQLHSYTLYFVYFAWFRSSWTCPGAKSETPPPLKSPSGLSFRNLSSTNFNFSVLTLPMSRRYLGNKLYKRGPNAVIEFSCRDCAGLLQRSAELQRG